MVPGRVSWVATVLLLSAAAAASAQDTAQVSIDTATLVVSHRPILTFRARIGAQTPAERASAAARRIEVAWDSGATEIALQRVPEGVLVFVGGRPAYTVTPADADTVVGESFDSLVRAAVQRTRVALAERAEQTSLRSIIRGAVLSLGATVLFLALLRLLSIARRAIQRRVDVLGRRHLGAVSIAGFKLFEKERILVIVNRLVDGLLWGAGLFLSYLWLTFVLTQFAFSRPWGEALGNYLVATLTSLLSGMIRGVPGIFTVVLIFVVTRFATRVVNAFFAAVQSETVKVAWLHPQTAQPTRRIVTALMWLFALAVSYPYLPGSDTDIFKGISIFAGLIITLGSTGVVGQAMSGLVLMYSRSLSVGEYVLIGAVEGVVVDLGMLSTKIRTPKGELVTIPNAVVVSNATKNYSRLQEHGDVVLYTSVTIGYDAPWRQVHALLQEAARRTPGVRAEPEPFVMQSALSDFYVEYQLNVYVEQPERRMSILAALHENIQDCFNEYGVQIMSPHFRDQPREPVVVPRERWREAPAP